MRETKYSKTLYHTISQLNLDKEELKGIILCLYLNGCSTEDCSKLFGTIESNIIKIIQFENLYNYQSCSKCGKLRDRQKDFRRTNTTICNICRRKYNRELDKKYYQKYKEKKRIYQNKEQKKIYMKNYFDNNKEKKKKYDKDHHKKYYQNNKNQIKESVKKYRQQYANINYVQQLSQIEEISGNQIKCKYCGKWLRPTICQVNNRLAGINTNDRGYIYCSEECKESCPIYGQKKYPKGFKHATSREVNPELRQLVLLRDNYTCQKCGKFENVSLHCHHIIPHINSPLETNDPDNCITLCKDCHKLVHKLPDCGYHELRCR